MKKSYKYVAWLLWNFRDKKKDNPLPDMNNLLAWYKGEIAGGKLIAAAPPSNHTTQQVKSSGFAGIGSGTLTGLLTTDDLTSSGPNTPTCTVDGTVTFGADCWDFFWHRDGVLMGYYPGINVGGTFEIDASGNGRTLYLTDTTITERLDGSGTNYANEAGYSVADGLTHYANPDIDFLLPVGTRFNVGYELEDTDGYQFQNNEIFQFQDAYIFEF